MKFKKKTCELSRTLSTYTVYITLSKYHFFCFFPIDFMASGFALFLLWKLARVISPQIMAD